MNESEKKGFFDGNPKMIFVFGLVTGVAVTALLGGGINLPNVQAGNRGNDVVRTFDTGDAGIGAAPSGTLAPITSDDHVRGDLKKAKVVLVEYSDFECPFCERHHPSLQQAMNDYGDDVAWVYRHFPLSFHPMAMPSALASECASEQGKFWEYGDYLFANQAQLSEDFLYTAADEVGLNAKKFADCYESQKYLDVVNADLASGNAAGVSGTPATFVNGVLVSGAVPYATLADAIESAIADAK